jgi:3-oxoacyl-[acyl-carrier protein] reductase
MQLKGKTALIAGAGRNNGRAIALTFAREGADVVIVARTRGDDLNQVAKECAALGVQALPVLADVARPDEVQGVVDQALQRYGKVDILVTATGMRPHKPFWQFSHDEWHHVFAVNLHSTFYFAKALAPGMIERKSGSIIALGGKAAMTSEDEASLIVASKHGLYGLIKSLARDLGPYGVRANLLALATIKSIRLNPEWYPHGLEADNPTISPLGLGRSGTNQEVANVALFLASDQSSYVTGDRILCMGGRYM